jgi:hypothetical protein
MRTLFSKIASLSLPLASAAYHFTSREWNRTTIYKTVGFLQDNQMLFLFSLGNRFQFVFDDLFGNEADYYYEIVHCDYNWVPTSIPKMNIYKDLIIKEFKIIPTPLTHCNSIRTTPYRYRINLPAVINQW